MVELSDEQGEFLDANTVGVLATLAPDGRPRQSLVYFARDSNRLVISTLTDRGKARDARRRYGSLTAPPISRSSQAEQDRA